MTLAQKLVALHRAFAAAGLPHAFGGAIALAYWTLEPRGTTDIDINVFVGVERVDDVFAALPDGVSHGPGDVQAVQRDGQVRLRWDGTPVDLFFDTVPLHGDAARQHRRVRFHDETIPVLGPVELACFKALSDRTKDWADIEAMVAAELIDTDAVRERLCEMVGAADPRVVRLDQAVERAIRDAR